ncbi:MAG: hypothetical protein GY832_21665 [Chloroflexi bacterium]|nr:hypothetical protein [Chloroflexota bacterium]
MTSHKYFKLLLVITIITLLSLACGKGNEAVPTDVPAQPEEETQVEEAPASEEAAAPAVPLGDAFESKEGGYSFLTIPDYITDEAFGFSAITAPDADKDTGPMIVLIGSLQEQEFTLDELFDGAVADMGRGEGELVVSEPTDLTLDGVKARTADLNGTTPGDAVVKGRVTVALVAPAQTFVMFGSAPADRWESEFSATFNAVQNSLAFFEPETLALSGGSDTGVAEEPLPELEIDPGWYVYSNANVVRDLVVYEGIAYAATLGGVVAWDLESGDYTKYTPLDGLKHISTFSIVVCDMPETRIVVGTEIGLSFFDPVAETWDNVPIVSADEYVNEDEIDRLYCDQANGRLLIGYSGVGILDLATGEYVQYTDEQGLTWNGVRDIAVDGSSIWIASGYNGISNINGDTVTTYDEDNGMPSERALSIEMDANGVLWVGTSSGLLKFSSGSWTLYDSDVGLFGEISEIELADDGTLWVTSYPIGTGRVCNFDPATEACLSLHEGEGVAALDLDEQGRAVFGTEDGVYVSDGANVTEYVIESDQLVTNFVDSMALDSNGMLWVGTDGGMHRLDPANPDAQWETYRSEYYSGDPNSPGGNWSQAIAAGPNGDMLFAITNGDASYFSGGVWTVFEDVYSYDATAIDSQGNLWLGDDGEGLLVLDTAGNQVLAFTSADGLPNDSVRTLLADGETMWIGTAAGLAKYENGALTVIFGEDDPALPHDNIFKLIKEDDGTLLIGTLSGLVRYDGASATTLNDFSEIDYWLSPMSMDIGMDGTFWVGTTSGLVYSSDDGATWTVLTTKDGLSTDQIAFVLVDQYGTVWAGGGNSYGGGGLLRIVP